MPVDTPPGRSLVTKRAVADVVRTATLGSYGVTGFAGHGLLPRVASLLHLRQPGMRIRLAPRLEIALWLSVAWGLPVAEVARQVDSAVRYGLRRALGSEVDSLVIHVNRLQVLPVPSGPTPSNSAAMTPAAAASSPDAPVAPPTSTSTPAPDRAPADHDRVH